MEKYNLDDKNGILGIFSVKSAAKIFKTGDNLELKHYNLFGSVYTSIIELNDNTLKVQSRDKIADPNFFPGDIIVLSSTGLQGLYAISGEISSIENLDPLILSINVKKIEKMENSRRNKRYFVSLLTYIKVPGIQENVFALGKNISLGGVKINCKEDIMMDDLVGVTITVAKDLKLNYSGRVVRKSRLNDYFEYGIEIYDITETNMKVLYRYIGGMEADL